MKSLDNLKKNTTNIKIIVSQDSDINDAINFFKKNSYKNLENYYDYDKAISKTSLSEGFLQHLYLTKNLRHLLKLKELLNGNQKNLLIG